MQITDAEKGKIITLGIQGENLARGIRFDFTEWSEIYGDSGNIQLIAQRSGDAVPYPVALEIEETKALWKVNNADTAYEGMGECELQYIIDEIVVKSITWKTRVLKSMGDSSPTPPEPQQSWVEQVLQASAAAQTAAEAAEASLDKQPFPNAETGTWWRYNSATGEFEDTGQPYSGQSDTFTYEQKSASTDWNISHNLDKFPSVSVVDSGGSVVDGEIKYIDSNNILIKFSSAFSGKAYLN